METFAMVGSTKMTFSSPLLRGVYEGKGGLSTPAHTPLWQASQLLGGKGGLAAVNSMVPAQATSIDVLVKPATTELRLLSNKSPQIPKHIFKIYFQNYTEHNSTNQ